MLWASVISFVLRNTVYGALEIYSSIFHTIIFSVSQNLNLECSHWIVFQNRDLPLLEPSDLLVRYFSFFFFVGERKEGNCTLELSSFFLRLYLKKFTLIVKLETWDWQLHSPRFSSVQFSRSVVSDCLRPHESQHARPPCPSPTPLGQPNILQFFQVKEANLVWH